MTYNSPLCPLIVYLISTVDIPHALLSLTLIIFLRGRLPIIFTMSLKKMLVFDYLLSFLSIFSTEALQCSKIMVIQTMQAMALSSTNKL